MKYKNNPLNIRYSRINNWIGQSGHSNGFCEFSDVEFGLRAACILLMRSYRKKGLKTYQDLISRFAPLKDNNPTNQYVHYVCNHLGVFPFDIPYTRGEFARMIFWMANFEQGKYPDFNEADVYKVMVIHGIKSFNMKVK